MNTTSHLPAESAKSTYETGRRTIEQLEQSPLYRDYRAAFEETTGLPLALRRVGSFQSPLHDSKRANDFCTAMAASNPLCAACLRLQQRLETEAVTAPQTVQCFAGLTESAAPIRVGNRVIGHLQTGQVLLHRPTSARFKAVVRKLRDLGTAIDPTKLEAAYFRTRTLPRRRYESAVRLIGVFAQHLAEVSNRIVTRANAGEEPAIARARAYLTEHSSENLSLGDVARAVNMSPFYFCKLFKRATGCTFTEYLARLRVEQVKQMLLNPHVRVSEAAFAAGFQSLSQFNRVFRQIDGDSPSAYRRRLHPRPSRPSAARAPLGALPRAA